MTYRVELWGGVEDGREMAFSHRPPRFIRLPVLADAFWQPVAEGEIPEVQTNVHEYEYVGRKLDGSYRYRFKGVT